VINEYKIKGLNAEDLRDALRLVWEVFVFPHEYAAVSKPLNTVTPDIQTPAAVGQYQHGSAKWLSEKEKDKAFESFVLDPDDELIKGLLQSGYDGLDFMKGEA